MATYTTAPETKFRVGGSVHTNLTPAPFTAKLAVVSYPRTYGAPTNPDAIYAVNGRDYAIGRVEGGAGDATRPLTGLLHPPDRRGNRAQVAAKP
jgi:hypothetical protein